MGQIDYRQKYQELKSKFMDSIDVAWRDGYENGMKDAQLEQVQQQQMQDQAMAQQGAPGAEQQPDEQIADEPTSEHPGGSELDQHIAKLESLIGKSEIGASDVESLKKALSDIKLYQSQIALTKSMESAKKVTMRKSFVNLKPLAKSEAPKVTATMQLQKQIVGDAMKAWADEETRAKSSILEVAKLEGLSKKE